MSPAKQPSAVDLAVLGLWGEMKIIPIYAAKSDK
jgi:hypothetical protein